MVQENKDISKDLAALKEDIAALTKQVGDIAKNKMSDLKEKGKDAEGALESSAYKIGAKARDIFENSEDKLKDAAYYLVNQSKSHPLLTIGLAFVAGMLIEKLGTSRRD
jgi:ElaB/YqjD/DUF883 family membrane-anchored ribosome-binding protein